MGDNEKPFVKLANNLKLPQYLMLSLTPRTCYLVIRAPVLIPLFEEEQRYSWIPSLDENTFECTLENFLFLGITFNPNRLPDIVSLRKDFLLLLETIHTSGKWLADRIFILGFSQGASVAIDAAVHFERNLGGIIGRLEQN